MVNRVSSWIKRKHPPKAINKFIYSLSAAYYRQQKTVRPYRSFIVPFGKVEVTATRWHKSSMGLPSC